MKPSLVKPGVLELLVNDVRAGQSLLEQNQHQVWKDFAQHLDMRGASLVVGQNNLQRISG